VRPPAGSPAPTVDLTRTGEQEHETPKRPGNRSLKRRIPRACADFTLVDRRANRFAERIRTVQSSAVLVIAESSSSVGIDSPDTSLRAGPRIIEPPKQFHGIISINPVCL